MQLGNVGLYKKVADDERDTRKYARDIPADRLDKLAFDYALVGLGVGIAILVRRDAALGFPLWVGFLAAGLHAVRYVMLSGAINAIGHTLGKQPYRQLRDERADRSRSSPVARACTTTTTRRRRRRASRSSAARSTRVGASCARSSRCASRRSATTTSS